MTLKAKNELAMILALPVPPKTADDAVGFINLEEYPNFFEDLRRGFPDRSAGSSGSGGLASGGAIAAPKLAVVEVGSFEASFIPKIADFERLDERFRFPAGTWNSLARYRSFGFAVFKLKPGEKRIHPMAFEFPRNDSQRLFFPTLHVHDGVVHAKAAFDHVLYCQAEANESAQLGHNWRESEKLAHEFVNVAKAKDVVATERHCYMRRLMGNLTNRDTLV